MEYSTGLVGQAQFCDSTCSRCPEGYYEIYGSCIREVYRRFFAIFVTMLVLSVLYWLIYLMMWWLWNERGICNKCKGVIEAYHLIWLPLLLFLTLETGNSNF